MSVDRQSERWRSIPRLTRASTGSLPADDSGAPAWHALILGRKGKRGRAKGRLEHRREHRNETAPTAAVIAPRLHVTVATVPNSNIEGSLVHDAALVKAALLYADHVTLVSPNALMFAGMGGLATPDSPARRGALMKMMAVLPEAEHPAAVYEDLRRKRRHLSPTERLGLLRMEQKLKSSGDELADVTQGSLDSAGMPELERAMDAGVLSIHLLNLEGVEADEFFSKAVDGLASVLAEAVPVRLGRFPCSMTALASSSAR